jgi:hypothetical protein
MNRLLCNNVYEYVFCYRQLYFSLKKSCGTHRVTQNSIGKGDVCYIAAWKKVPERCSSLHLSEKELPELLAGAFRHKNTPGYNHDSV